MPKQFTFLLFMLIGLFGVTSAFCDDGGDINSAGANVNIMAANADTIHAAGGRVTIEATARKNLRAAGAIVDVNAEVGDNLHLAGSRITANGTVGGELWIAGAELEIGTEVTGATHAAGALVTVVDSARLGPNSSLAAAHIDFNGEADENLSLYADEVSFSGQAKGAVTIEATRVSLLETARIDGDLTIYSIEAPEISPNAVISGQLNQVSGFSQAEEEDSIFEGLGSSILIIASAFLWGLFLTLYFRHSLEQSISTFREQAGKSLLWGLLVFIGVPIVAFIAMVIVVGIPLGVTLLLLIPLLTLMGYTGAAFGLSDWLLNKKGEELTPSKRLLYLLAGLIFFMVIDFIPVLGNLVVFLATLAGLGATTYTFYSWLKIDNRPLQVAT